jgi:hypothetical protein
MKCGFGESSQLQVRMENDDKEEWGEVMFVPAGALTQTQSRAEPEPKGRSWRKGK